MIYLSQMLGKPVLDREGENIGIIQDLAITTGEVFPRVTAVAFKGPDKTPFMLSWRKFVEIFDGEAVRLNVVAAEIRFSYLQPDELLLSRDLLNKQIVDTQGMKVVRVNDLKLSESHNSLRLLGAEVGARGLLRAISPGLERVVRRAAGLVGQTMPENLIAWNYMDLLERDLSQVKLSVTHKRLHELHPADVADILETLAPNQRAAVFAHLDNEHAAETISELEDELQADVIEDLSERRASDLLAEMDPDDAADIIGDLDYDKAERLLRLMGVEDSDAIRGLLGYKEKTAGGIMTSEVTVATADMTVSATIELIREVHEERESIHYVYIVDSANRLTGVVSLRDLLLNRSDATLGEFATNEDLFKVKPDDDQEEVAEMISKYDLLAIPVVDDMDTLLGVVTIDDAFDVLEEEAEEDLARATGRKEHTDSLNPFSWILPRRFAWLIIWLVSVGTVALGISYVRINAGQLSGSAEMFAGGIWGANVAILALPMLLLAIEDAILRGVQMLTDLDPEDRPSTLKRYGFGTSVGLLSGSVIGGLIFLYIDLTWIESGRRFGMVLAILVVLIALFASILSTFLVNRTVASDDKGRPVAPTSVATIVMSLVALTLIGACTALPLIEYALFKSGLITSGFLG